MMRIIFIFISILGYIISLETIYSNQFQKKIQNEAQIDSTNKETIRNDILYIPLESFKVFTNPLFAPQNNIELKTGSNTFIPLGFTTNADYFIYLNKSELLQGLNKKYQLSKPGTFQQILGMFQAGAAAALAGYHVYKYEIKKEKK